MKEEHPIIRELERIGPAHFRKLQYCREEDAYFVKLRQENYLDLICTVSDLLKLCIMATEEGLEVSDPRLTRLDVSVHTTLKLIFQLLPLHESEFLDHLRAYFGGDG